MLCPTFRHFFSIINFENMRSIQMPVDISNRSIFQSGLRIFNVHYGNPVCNYVIIFKIPEI